eukprot:Hpha_TRINITY_DN15275_c2_g6::TRINITY_DN15275_c2_g6_i1::g.64390::m.64390
MVPERNAEHGKDYLGGQHATLLGVLLGLLLREVEQLHERVGVEEPVLRLPEDVGELLEVVVHHRLLRHALEVVDQGVDVLDGLVSVLPRVELDRHLKLLETGLHHHVEHLGVRQEHVGAVLLLLAVLGVHRLGQVVTEEADTVVTEPLLLGVLEAEVEGADRGLVEDGLELGLTVADLEGGPVALVQVPQPGGQVLTADTVLRLLLRHGAQDHRLRSLVPEPLLVELRNTLLLVRLGGSLQNRRGVLAGLLGGQGTLLALLDERLDHLLQRVDVGHGGETTVVDEVLLDRALQLHTQVHDHKHDLLVGRSPDTVTAVADDILAHLKGHTRLVLGKQLLRTPDCILRAEGLRPTKLVHLVHFMCVFSFLCSMMANKVQKL